MWGQTIADPFTLVRQTVPVEQDVDVVQQLEKELRAEKKGSSRNINGSNGWFGWGRITGFARSKQLLDSQSKKICGGR